MRFTFTECLIHFIPSVHPHNCKKTAVITCMPIILKEKPWLKKKLDWFQAAQVVYVNWGMVSGFGFSLSGQGYSETWLEIIRDVSMRVL